MEPAAHRRPGPSHFLSSVALLAILPLLLGSTAPAAQGENGGVAAQTVHTYMPPGPLGGVCTFAAGDYTFDVVPEVGMSTDEVPPQGQVFAK